MSQRPIKPPPIHPAITVPHDFKAVINSADVWAYLEARIPLPEKGEAEAEYRREWREAVSAITRTVNVPRAATSMQAVDALACVGLVKDALTYALLVANGQMKRRRPRRPKAPKARLRLVKGPRA